MERCRRRCWRWHSRRGGAGVRGRGWVPGSASKGSRKRTSADIELAAPQPVTRSAAGGGAQPEGCRRGGGRRRSREHQCCRLALAFACRC